MNVDARPSVTIQPLPSIAREAPTDGGGQTWKDFVVNINSNGVNIRLPLAGENEAPTARPIKDGDVISFSQDGPRFRCVLLRLRPLHPCLHESEDQLTSPSPRFEWRPTILKLDVVSKTQADIVRKITPLGAFLEWRLRAPESANPTDPATYMPGLKVVKKDFEGSITHLVLETVKSISKPSILAALASNAHIVSPAFINALVQAAQPLPPTARDSSSKERWSALEFDAAASWPSEDGHAPKFEVAGEDAARGSLLRNDSRTTIFGGLTVVGIGNDVRRPSMRAERSTDSHLQIRRISRHGRRSALSSAAAVPLSRSIWPSSSRPLGPRFRPSFKSRRRRPTRPTQPISVRQVGRYRPRPATRASSTSWRANRSRTS